MHPIHFLRGVSSSVVSHVAQAMHVVAEKGHSYARAVALRVRPLVRYIFRRERSGRTRGSSAIAGHSLSEAVEELEHSLLEALEAAREAACEKGGETMVEEMLSEEELQEFYESHLEAEEESEQVRLAWKVRRIDENESIDNSRSRNNHNPIDAEILF